MTAPSPDLTVPDDVDVLELDRAALRLTGEVVARITDADLAAPTPCTRWTVRDVLAHLVDVHRIYTGLLAPLPGGVPDAVLGADPRPEHGPAGQRLLDAYTTQRSAPDGLDRVVTFPGAGSTTARAALYLHLVEVLVHGWDLATGIGAQHSIPDELAAPALVVAEQYPDPGGDPDAPFAAPVPALPADPPGARLLARLGRNPHLPFGPGARPSR